LAELDGLVFDGSKSQHVYDKWWMDLPLAVTPYVCKIRCFRSILITTVSYVLSGVLINNAQKILKQFSFYF
jgi:heterodisulfide reductase subunit C